MIRDNKGFTLLEMAIGVLLTGVVVSAAFSLYLTQHKQLTVQDQISDMQFNIRAAANELSTRIRMAGFELPQGLETIQPIQGFNTNPDSIAIAYASTDLRGLQIEQAMPEPSAVLKCDGHDLSSIRENDQLYIFDPILMTGEYFVVTGVDLSSYGIQHNTTNLSHAYPVGSRVLKPLHFKYYIDASDSGHPNLVRQENSGPPTIFAENIADMQFEYTLSSLAVVDVPVIPRMIKEVKISITARTDQPDSKFLNLYRTRTFSTRAKVRNLGVN
jgi:prepilin-type N-terminal cleavage/methylation domain-containing protein